MRAARVRSSGAGAACAAALLLVAAPGRGQEASGPWNLETCVARAEQLRPEIREAGADVAAAAAGTRAAEAGYSPTASVSVEYQRVRGGFSSGSAAGVNDFSLAVGAQWTATDLAWVPIDVRAAERREESAFASAEAVRRAVRFEVVAAYHGLWAARRLAELTRESLAAAEKHREVAEARRQASLGARPDVARAEVEVADARLAMAQADTAARAARASLAHAMGLSPGTPFEIVDAEPEPGPLPPAPASHADRPEVRALLLDAEASRADAEAAAAGYWPEVTVAASYGVSDDRFFPTEQVWYVGAAVDVPLLSWWSTGASIDSAEAQASATEARSETLENAAALEVDAARLAIDEANARLEASAAMIASAEENVRVAEGLYAEGAGSMIEVVDARDALQRARMARITGLRDLALAAARYRYAVGEEP